MSLWVSVLGLLLLLCTQVVAAGAEPRLTDAEKRALLASRGRLEVAIRDARVISATVENSKITENLLGGSSRLRAWITLRVVLAQPFEEDELDGVAAAIREAAGKFDTVAIRFLLPSSEAVGERDTDAGPPFYAWRLYHDQSLASRSMLGVAPSTVAAQAKDIGLRPGEQLVGIWVDHYFVNGAVALIRDGPRASAVFLFDPTDRHLLPDLPVPGGRRVEATAVKGPLGEFRADGDGADRLGLKIDKQNRLLVYGGRDQLADKPWLIARPWSAPKAAD